MGNILYCECLKLKRSKIIRIGFSGTLVVPFLAIIQNLQRYFKNTDTAMDLFGLYDNAIMFLMLLFAPLFLSIIGTYLISREYSENTLKIIFAVPISRKAFLTGKFLILFIAVIMFMLISWFNLLILSLICNLFLNITQITVISAIFFLIKMLSGGILLYMTITPIMYLSIRYKGFILPFSATAAICFLNVIISGSSIAGLFPPTAAYLVVSGRSNNQGYPPSVGFMIIVLLFMVSIIASMKHFLKEDI